VDLGYLLERAIQSHRARLAVTDGSRSLRYGELGERSARLVNALAALGLRAGDSVVVLLTNRLEFAEIDIALARGGFVRVALNARLNVEDFSTCVDDSDARAIITESAFDEDAAELVTRHRLAWLRLGADGSAPAYDYEALLAGAPTTAAIPARSPSLPAWISYTSGTTGKPKGIILSHGALCSVAFNFGLEVGPITDQSSILLPQPLSHGAGYFLLAYLAAGATAVIMSQFDPERANELARGHGIQTLKLVPTMLSSIVDLGVPTPFETIIYGAEPIKSRLLDRALELFGPRLVQVYGQSEAPSTISCLKKHEHAPGAPERLSAGRPWRTVQAKIVDGDGQSLPVGAQGELVISGPQLMNGYHKRPETTAEVLRDGWLWTRDLAQMDENGFIYLRGRSDQMIISGGFNIAPAEVEQILSTHPEVHECAAFGVPDEQWGSAVAAAVVRTPGSALDEPTLTAYCADRLGFRKPRRVLFLESLPYSAYGKIDRKALLARVQSLPGAPR
jgi:acyl-CoA synthetase (AMP-forming)/AMP-acid ligase II